MVQATANCHEFNHERITHIKSLINSNAASAEDGGNFRNY
jgi:hypothetical protein